MPADQHELRRFHDAARANVRAAGLATLGVGFALRDSGTGEVTEVLTAAAGMTLTYLVVLIAVGLSRSERVALATWVRTRTT